MRHLISVALLLATSAHADLTLNQAIRTALEHNYQLARDAILVNQAAASVAVAQGPFDLRVGADASVKRYLSVYSGPQTDLAWDVYLAKRVSTGADLQLRLDTSLTRTSFFLVCDTAPDSTDECSLFTPSLTASLTQPLLRGAWPSVVGAPQAKAEIARSAAGWRRAARASELLRDVTGAFWEVTYSTREIDIRQGALDLARRQLELTRAEIAAGRLAPADSLAVELAIAQREAELIAAENGQLERSLALRRLLGEPIPPDVSPYQAHAELALTPEPPDPAARRARALERNATLRAIRLDGRVKEIDAQVARRGLLPTLNLTGAVGVAGQDDAYGGALGNMFDSDAHANDNAGIVWSGGLSFLHFIGDRTAQGADEIARLEARRSALEIADVEAEIAAQAVRLAMGLRAAAKLLETSRVALKLAQQNLAAEQARFTVGRVRNQDVLARQEELRQTQLRELRSTVDYLKLEATLDSITADLLDRYGVAPR